MLRIITGWICGPKRWLERWLHGKSVQIAREALAEADAVRGKSRQEPRRSVETPSLAKDADPARDAPTRFPRRPA